MSPILLSLCLFLQASSLTCRYLTDTPAPTRTAFLSVGDSKTLSVSGLVQSNFKTLMDAAHPELHTTWDVTTPAGSGTLAFGGITTAGMAARIDADLLASGRLTPVAIIYNLGANDTDVMPAEADWTTNTLHNLDALHTKWPNAPVYLMRPWVRGKDADSDTLAGWIAAAVAARPDFARLGPDERVFLKAGDNGATYMTDDKHPNAAGYALTAAQWQTALGY